MIRLSCKAVWVQLLLFICCLYSFAAMAVEAYDEVKSDIQAGRTETALETLRMIVRKQPDDYQAWFLIGVASTRQQHYHQAIEAFRRVIELNPRLAEPHNNLAVIYNELGDVRAAVDELEQSIKKRPGYAIAEENLADLYVKLALQNYRSALKSEPNPGLQQRYLRLLQVRDPAAVSDPVPVLPEGAVTPPVSQQEAAELVAEQSVVTRSEKDDAPEGTKRMKEMVLEAVEAWRVAWSSRNLAGYFSAYGEDFHVPERFASFEAWQRYKRRVIGSKAYIQVELSDVQVEVDEHNGRASVRFFQKFRSNNYNSDNVKVLKMRLDHGVWKIVSEVSLS